MGVHPLYLVKKEIPDEKLLSNVKRMVINGASMSAISRELKISNYKASRYYWKVMKKEW